MVTLLIFTKLAATMNLKHRVLEFFRFGESVDRIKCSIEKPLKTDGFNSKGGRLEVFLAFIGENKIEWPRMQIIDDPIVAPMESEELNL